jgi:hypothetical protein
MSAASNYLENKVLDHVLGEGARTFTSPATLYLALFNNTSGNALANLEAGTLTDEISTSGTAYGRQAVDFAAAASGTAATNGTVTWTTATASWGTVTHVAVMDGGTVGSGNVLFYGALTASKAIDTGDTFQISSSNLTVSLA